MFSSVDGGSINLNGGHFFHTIHNSSHSSQNPHWGQEFAPPLSTTSTAMQLADGDPLTDSSPRILPQPQFQQSAYMHESQQFQLRDQYRVLESQIVKVTAERDSVIAAYQYLASAVRFPISDPFQFNSSLIPTLTNTGQRPNPKTHPKVQFWNKADYLEWLDSADAEHTVLRGKLAFLEDSDGNPISETTIDAIRKALRAAWSELLIRKLAPLTWGKLTTSGAQLMNSLMENAYPIFKLANNGWKLDYLATMSYASWRRNHMDKFGNPLVGRDNEGDATSKGKKRKQGMKFESEVPEAAEKKIKVDCGTQESTTPPPAYPSQSSTPLSPPQAESRTSATPQVATPVLEEVAPEDIIPEPLSAPKPVKVMIVNPLSTLALAASGVDSIDPSLELLVQSTSKPAAEDAPGSVRQVASSSTMTSKPKTVSKGPMRPGPAKNGRNLCALRWLRQIKRGGKTDEFNAYYGSLTSVQREKYDKEAKILVDEDKWTKGVNEGHIY